MTWRYTVSDTIFYHLAIYSKHLFTRSRTSVYMSIYPCQFMVTITNYSFCLYIYSLSLYVYIAFTYNIGVVYTSAFETVSVTVKTSIFQCVQGLRLYITLRRFTRYYDTFYTVAV